MALTDLAFASGFSSLLIVLIGYVLGLYLLSRYRSNPDKNTLALAVVLISIGSVWLAIAVNFILSLAGYEFLQELPYMLLLGWIPGVTGITLGYMFVSIVKEEYLKPALVLFGLFFIADVAVMYVIVPFGIGDFTISSVLTFTQPPNDLPNASVSGIWRIFVLISIVIMLLIALFFLLTALRTDIKRVRARAGLLGIGLIITTVLLYK